MDLEFFFNERIFSNIFWVECVCDKEWEREREMSPLSNSWDDLGLSHLALWIKTWSSFTKQYRHFTKANIVSPVKICKWNSSFFPRKTKPNFTGDREESSIPSSLGCTNSAWSYENLYISLTTFKYHHPPFYYTTHSMSVEGEIKTYFVSYLVSGVKFHSFGGKIIS